MGGCHDVDIDLFCDFLVSQILKIFRLYDPNVIDQNSNVQISNTLINPLI
jgi:hypothetical protein